MNRPSGARPLALALGLLIQPLARSEDLVDFKFEYYAEEKDRIQVRTHSVLFQIDLAPHWALKGSAVYDGISGATPRGGPPVTGAEVTTVGMHDVRTAGALEVGWRFGRHTIRPQVAYSVEEDYTSFSPALNYLIDFNRRNTSLNLGVAHNFDHDILGLYVSRPQQKDVTDFVAGLTQVLSPSTLGNVTLTLGTASGYLSDPYKGFRFTGYPVESALFPEHRPGHRTKQIVSAMLTQFIDPAQGSAELTYRFYHDSFGLFGHTVTLEWFQKMGRYLVLAPLFRYYRQGAADFYLISFEADPSDPDNPNNALVPQFYSSDYRLSQLHTFSYGVSARVRLRRWLYAEAACKRYEMLGLDEETSSSNYPKANVYTIGLQLHF